MPQDFNYDELFFSIREFCLGYFDNYVYNELPTHLIRISDMKLLSRNDIWGDLRPHVESMAIFDGDEDEKGEDEDEGEDEKEDEEESEDEEEAIWAYYKSRIHKLLRYAILSHRWSNNEPEFYEMSSKRYGERPMPTGPRFEKLRKFCEKARDEYECAYAWSDTCCLNKESSMELEEAIRSMYRWYRDAYVCIVFLAKSFSIQDFWREPWFTRGWTLQELLAPRRLRFFGAEWTPICPMAEVQFGDIPLSHDIEQVDDSFPYPNDKASDFMLNAISQVTGIQATTLRCFDREKIALCEKMRWASNRNTTRVEDIAYCLLGIFDISIPIAYGEGGRAFYRLMEAIVQRSGDPTLFAWAGKPSPYSRALPSSPACYINPLLRGLPLPVSFVRSGDPFYTVTKVGLQVKLLVVAVECVSVHRGNGSIRHELKSIDRALPQLIITTSFGGDIYPTGSRFALGVVNYRRPSRRVQDDEAHGTLDAGQQYFCVLIDVPSGDPGPRLKIETGNILIIRCTEEFKGELETVCLLHADW
ncbi:hypothetical protein PAXINDRAFT_140233 [Paxillus involutus ATCC 200175]|uniref:Heterokaryon incompatibility domain-containing protein n=1 Tax=Paxillus involutus ATCC 200175 TaxID=664439 RepID=A0A0C9TG92_PAXIN|nr:hypothetical protein PAXINDRAFT_140233 [Paxillus involutus ATCC 200175]